MKAATHTLQRGWAERTWLTYAQAAEHTGYTVRSLQNLVCSGRIPVYGKPRSRRFRRDMLDAWLTNPDMAMRRFAEERANQT